MKTSEGIMLAATPSWPEFTSSAANGTYMLTINYAVSGTLNLNANVTIIFAGGRFTGSGTIAGNNTTFIAPPIQVFDSTINFSGTWKMEKVYAENFGDTNGTNSAPTINKALLFSNISGCIVQLLGKTYNITQTIDIRGGTTLQGTIMGTSSPGNSVVSKEGTVILASGSVTAINIRTTGNGSTSDVDCYRFVLNLLTIRHTGNGLGINIEAAASTTLTPRSGVLTNIRVIHTLTTGNYGLRVAGGSYIKFDYIFVNGGKGVLVTGTHLQEFLWFNKIILNGVSGEGSTSFEITHGNNLYLTEVDTNGSDIGLQITNETGGTFNIFVNRFNSVKCRIGINVKTFNDYITRLKVSEAIIYQTTDKAPTAGINFDKINPSSGFFIGESLFENINFDVDSNVSTTTYFSIKENNNSVDKCRFLNIRTGRKTQLRANNSQVTFMGIKQAGTFTDSAGKTVYETILTSNSPFPGKPVMTVSTNQKIPFSVDTTSTQGGTSKLTVTFASATPSAVVIHYSLTGYFYT